MQQATASGWYSTEDGGEVFIPAGIVRHDNHPDVKAIPSLFQKLVTDEYEKPASTKAESHG